MDAGLQRDGLLLLVVLDNVESLLTEAGEWRDPRWASVEPAGHP
jgi:hypothetical protein